MTFGLSSKGVLQRAAGARIAGVLFLFGILGATWLSRVPLLRVLPDLWATSDPVGPAEAVAVLGGGLETRPVAAADYYRRGWVSKVLLANVGLDPREAPHSETAANKRVLLSLGVPAYAIELFGTDLSSTYEESVALREWTIRNRARRLIVPTEYFSSRRVRWIMTREFAGTGTTVLVPALDYPGYSRKNWWRDRRAVALLESELMKYAYYRLFY
jgi:hypothetical protein